MRQKDDKPFTELLNRFRTGNQTEADNYPVHSVNKQLLDEVFVTSRVIEVKVGVISRSRRLRLITLTETSIILDITKTESNNCFIIH